MAGTRDVLHCICEKDEMVHICNDVYLLLQQVAARTYNGYHVEVDRLGERYCRL